MVLLPQSAQLCHFWHHIAGLFRIIWYTYGIFTELRLYNSINSLWAPTRNWRRNIEHIPQPLVAGINIDIGESSITEYCKSVLAVPLVPWKMKTIIMVKYVNYIFRLFFIDKVIEFGTSLTVNWLWLIFSAKQESWKS